MLRGGLDPGFVFTHPILLTTFILSAVAWIIAFAGQCASEAKFAPSSGHGPVQGVLWFNIWLELGIIIHFYIALANDALALHRFQISILLAIATAISVAGVQPIFQTPGAYIATGVGWLLLTIVNLVWILYITSEEDTFLYNLLNAGGTGGLSPNHRRVHSAGTGGYGGEMGRGGGGGGGGGTLGGMSVGGGGVTRGVSVSGNAMTGGGYASGGYAPAATESTPQKGGAGGAGGVGGAGMGGDVFGQVGASPGGDDAAGYKYRARALYAYSASPDDPNEVSFMKGDILDVVDNSGKWYSVRTPTGATGIAPSNYLTML